MKIKFEKINTEKIEKALSDINGKAFDHCFTYFSEIEKEFNEELKAFSLIPKKEQIGIKINLISGKRVKSAYKYSRNATLVKIECFSSGWFITEINREEIYQAGGSCEIYISEKQKNILIQKLINDRFFIQKSEGAK